MPFVKRPSAVSSDTEETDPDGAGLFIRGPRTNHTFKQFFGHDLCV